VPPIHTLRADRDVGGRATRTSSFHSAFSACDGSRKGSLLPELEPASVLGLRAEASLLHTLLRQRVFFWH